MNRKSQSTGIVYTFGEALAVFHKIAAHASGLNHVINKGQTRRTNNKTFQLVKLSIIMQVVNHITHSLSQIGRAHV